MRKVVFEYFGVVLSLTWQDSGLDEAVSRLLLPVWNVEPGPGPSANFHLSVSQGELLVEGPEDEPERFRRPDSMASLERRVHFYLANHCQDVVFVHAGAVAWRGQVILIPGSSYSGKSTLTYNLVEAGAEYFSDEYAVVDRSGLIHPFPRPIDLRDGQSRRKVIPPCSARSPLPLGTVLVTSHLPGCVWSPEEVSRGRAVLELLSHTVTARKDPRLAMHCLQACVENSTVLLGPRGEARETTSLVLQDLDARLAGRESLQ